MSATSNSRFWPITWLVLAIAVIPFLLARFLFDVNQFEIGVLFALLGLFLWLVSQGAGWRAVAKDTVVIVKDSMGDISAHPRRSYLYIPIVRKVEAILPSYPFRFEFSIEKIDTQTLGLSKIDMIRVRLDCVIKEQRYKEFFEQSASRLDLIKSIEDGEKKKRTEPAMWKRFLDIVLYDLVDDIVRDVVWTWSDAATNDPYGLSQKRRDLAQQLEAQLAQKLSKWELRLIIPVVLESIEIDPEIIKRKLGDRQREKEKAVHDASLLAAAIREKGFAEADVRARNVAALLDVLLKEYEIPYTDPLIAQIVRAALYADGSMIWSGVIEKGADGKTKTA